MQNSRKSETLLWKCRGGGVTLCRYSDDVRWGFRWGEGVEGVEGGRGLTSWNDITLSPGLSLFGLAGDMLEKRMDEWRRVCRHHTETDCRLQRDLWESYLIVVLYQNSQLCLSLVQFTDVLNGVGQSLCILWEHTQNKYSRVRIRPWISTKSQTAEVQICITK